MNQVVSTGELLGVEEQIYSRRFSEAEEDARAKTWKILVKDFFQKFVKPDAVVIDLGAGDGNFIKNIRAGRKVVVDLNTNCNKLKESGIEVILAPATQLSQVFQGKADVIFMSNFLEHLPTKQVLLDVLTECRKVLSERGKILILQPNIRYVKEAYWDYVDHQIALTDKSLVEALDITGFTVKKLIPRFLPYTAKSTLGHLSSGEMGLHIVRWYLRCPFLWRICGQQTFVEAKLRKEVC